MPIPRKPSLTLSDIRFPAGTQFRTAREHKEALSLIRRLAVSPGVAVADQALSAATLELLTGGRSAARVFKLTPFFGPGRRVQAPPVVVKIAPRAEGVREKANYDKFVRWALPAACRPDLLGFDRTRAYSGLCFSFVGRSGGSGIDTLTDCLQRGDATKVELVLRRFFDPLRDTWYSPAQFRAEREIARRYLDRYFTGPRSTAETEATLLACAERYFNARQKDGRYVIGGLLFPSPRATLFSSGRKRPYRSCILHGDLNSDNILVADDPAGVTVVDFQKTGRGHVYEDLIHLEASVRINYLRDASFGGILEKERLIALGRRAPRNDPYSAAIRKIRDAAFRYFGRVDDEANYHFAVAAIGLRLMRTVDLSHVARARITASALWAAKALAREI
jgi:Ternary complex associated domain 9